ncbi:MAG: MBL fold metallo-hydrolase [Dehalococcoidia bacterium]|nr:MBL fold metallo-hydrolase [Dehalococcoidia bacterium]
MDITYLGHSCFRLKGKDVTLITDPYWLALGSQPPRQPAQIVTVSHAHPGHSNTAAIDGQPRVLRGPGEYEVAGVAITGLPSFHDAEEGKKLGKNTIYLIVMEDLSFCHLGDLGHLLTPSLLQDLGKPDVLFVPVGGVNSLDSASAAETAKRLSPRVVIPMHYRSEAAPKLGSLNSFLKEMGAAAVAPRPRLPLTRANLPEKMEIVVLSSPLTP